MGREPSSINSGEDRESSAEDNFVQRWRKKLPFWQGKEDLPEKNRSGTGPDSIESSRDPARDHREEGLSDDRECFPDGESEARSDRECAADTLEEPDIRSEQNQSGDEDEVVEPHGVEPGPSDGTPRADHPAEPTVSMSEDEDVLDANATGPTGDNQFTGKRESDPESGSGDPSAGDDGVQVPAPGETVPDEVDETANGPTPSPVDNGDELEEVILEPRLEDGSDNQFTGKRESDSESGSGDPLAGDEGAQVPASEETVSDEVDETANDPTPSPVDNGDDLEEMILEPRSEDGSLEPGVLHMIGDVHYVVTECLPRGYYRGHNELDDQTKSVLFHPSPLSHRERWREAGGHRMLPEIRYEGEDGHVLEDVQGAPVGTGLSLQQALQTLDSVRQLMRFLSVRCRAAVTDICIEGLVLTTDAGLRLRYLPALIPMGEPAHVSCSDGATPIEGSETEEASERTSVFLWGAMLHALVTGEPLSAEGLDTNALARLRVPGLPQLLAATLEQQHPCPDLRTLRDICRDFMVSPAPRYMVGAATTVGLNPDRLCNEDSYGVVHSRCEYHDSRPQLVLACVADGMGGEEAGEIASKAAVDAFCRAPVPESVSEAAEQIQWTRGLGWRANRAVLDALAGSGGGCTLTGSGCGG